MEQSAANRSPTSDGSAEKVQQAKDAVQEGAQQATGQARERIREQVDQRSTQAGEQVRSAAGDARSVAEQLRSQGKDKPAQLAEQAADRVERVGSYLQESDADRILRDVEDFGRRKPWAVVAGGLAIGFAASRFLKASSGSRYRSSLGGQDTQGTPAPSPQQRIPAQPSRPDAGSPASGGLTPDVPPVPAARL